MRALHWLRHEIRAVLIATAYFACCFLLAMLLKRLVLEGYGIAFSGVATALLLALVTAKVVVALEKAPIGHRIGLVEALGRTSIYTLAALLLMLIEKAASSRDAAGGFLPALASVLGHPDMPHVWAGLICVAFAFAGYNAFAIARRSIGDAPLRRAFLGGA